jgi:hypothetical protein
MKCIVAIGLYRWCLLGHPVESETNKEVLQCLRDEEWEQNLEINLSPGIYELELFTDPNSEELTWEGERMLYVKSP